MRYTRAIISLPKERVTMFRNKRVIYSLATIVLFFSISVFSATHFTVRHIKVVGLQRVSEATVLSAMPIHVGQIYKEQMSGAIITSIYKTGFFDDVNLQRQDQTLVVKVAERPTIASIRITGNDAIKSKQLKPILKQLGIVVGKTFNPTQLHEIVQGLQHQYALMGKASATVKPSIERYSRNRVGLTIRIQEGSATIIREIKISGNHAFSESKLLSQFKLSTPGIFSWFTHDDRYSQMRLSQDLQSLQNFYFNHGYLDFKVLSHKVTHLPDGRGVSISVNVSEGPVYYISGYRLDAKLPPELIGHVKTQLSAVQKGSVFSRKDIITITQGIGNYLADHGYAFPQIHPLPQLDRAKRKVFIVFKVSSGHRVYVRKIHIAGNVHTSGMVVRSQMRQPEGGLYSQKNVNESKRLLANLGYLNNIQVVTAPVPGKSNQVDLNYHVHEVSTGKATVQGGYSDVNGFLYGANISEPNFMGTGRYVALGFQRSEYTSSYNFSYNNPFYTDSGISRGMNFFYNHTTPGKVNIDPYTMDSYGAGVNYGIPVSEYNQMTFGGAYNHVAISNVNSNAVSPSVTNFLSQKDSPYNLFKFSSGFSHSTLNQAIFPSKGNAQDINLTLGVPVLDSSLGYYQLSYNGRWYFPVGHGFIVSPHTTLGYGDGYGDVKTLPFFNNFFAGGIQTLPGYEANTLGPKNPNDLSQSLGGNVEMIGGLNFILPNFISDKVRTAIILDAGNIFQTDHVPGISYESVSLKNLRVTAGIMVSWWSPLGAPIDFSLAEPLNKKPGDQLALFGFSFGATL